METCDKRKEKIGFPCNPSYLTQSLSFCKGNQVYKQALLEANRIMFRLNECDITFVPLTMQKLLTGFNAFSFHSGLSVQTNQINQDTSLQYRFGSSFMLSYLEVVIIFYPQQTRFSHLQNVRRCPVRSDTACCSACCSCITGTALVCWNVVWLPQQLLIQ